MFHSKIPNFCSADLSIQCDSKICHYEKNITLCAYYYALFYNIYYWQCLLLENNIIADNTFSGFSLKKSKINKQGGPNKSGQGGVGNFFQGGGYSRPKS